MDSDQKLREVSSFLNFNRWVETEFVAGQQLGIMAFFRCQHFIICVVYLYIIYMTILRYILGNITMLFNQPLI